MNIDTDTNIAHDPVVNGLANPMTAKGIVVIEFAMAYSSLTGILVPFNKILLNLNLLFENCLLFEL